MIEFSAERTRLQVKKQTLTKMKKVLIFIFTIYSLTAFAQSGSQAVSGIKYRVNDSTAYISAVATAHAQGYADIFFNNQATVPHFDIWNGSSYDHVFNFNSGGGGGSQSLQDVITVSDVLTSPVAITTADPVSITSDDGAGNVAAFSINPSSDVYLSREDASNSSSVGAITDKASLYSNDKTNTFGQTEIVASTDGANTGSMTSTNFGGSELAKVETTPLISRMVAGTAGTSKVELTKTTLEIAPNNVNGNNGQVLTSDGQYATWQNAASGLSGSGTTNEIAYFTGASALGSLTTATYPSLTELAYVKGVTSAIQTQINAKQATLISGTNIKTVGGTSLLGSGNVTEVTQTVTNGVTTTSPSEDAVYDALLGVAGYTSTVPEIRFASISGQTMKGRILTCNKFYRDIDGTAESGTTFQWVRADDAIGTNVANIASATSSTYTLVTADNTKYIACKITPANAGETGAVYTTAYVGAVDDTYYPADQSNVVISYGIKKMASAYAGNCIQIQLTNGGATTNIGFDANGDLDWALVSSTASGGSQPAYLKIWYDQSGNGFNMIFSAFAKQPVVNYTLKRIEWITTNDATVTHNAAMNIGTGDFSFFMEATQRSLMDNTFTFFEKKTSFSAQNWQLYSPVGVGMLMYTGDASVNTLVAPYATPDRRNVIAGYRSSTAKFLNTDGVIKTSSETALTLTSTTDIKFNTGDGGTGEWYMWSWTFYTANKGSDYSKYKKFVSPDL